MFLLSSADFFFKINFQEHYQIDQDGRSVSPDLGTNCLQRLSADNKSGR